jgi:hypothetical protein
VSVLYHNLFEFITKLYMFICSSRLFKVKYTDNDKEDYSIYKINGMFKFVDDDSPGERSTAVQEPVVEDEMDIVCDADLNCTSASEQVVSSVVTGGETVPIVKEKIFFDLTGMSEVVVKDGDSVCSKLCEEFDGLSVGKNDILSYSKFTNKDTGKKMKMIIKFVEDEEAVEM